MYTQKRKKNSKIPTGILKNRIKKSILTHFTYSNFHFNFTFLTSRQSSEQKTVLKNMEVQEIQLVIKAKCPCGQNVSTLIISFNDLYLLFILKLIKKWTRVT